MISPLMYSDFYKTDHRRQYPKGTEYVYSNFTARGSRIEGIDHTVVFGIQHFLKEYLIHRFDKGFFSRPLNDVLYEYKRRLDNALGKDAVPIDHIKELHDLGYLPLHIKALPEGTRCPLRVPCLTVVNTNRRFFWLTNFIETMLSNCLWGPMTSATTAHRFRTLLDEFAGNTSDCPEFVDFQGHDFSMRGMSSMESACMSGAAHLLSFRGTDVIPAIDFLEEYYEADATKELIGGSVPATEHSVMCLGQEESEEETFKRLLIDVYPTGIVSVVSDTWDYWKVLAETLPKIKDLIMSREGKLTIRPDSGDPATIIAGEQYNTYPTLSEAEVFEKDIVWNEASLACEGSYNCGQATYTRICKVSGEYYCISYAIDYGSHDKQYYFVDSIRMHSVVKAVATPEFLGSIEVLWNTFGGTINSKGYKELDSHIGLIYGDAISYERCEDICKRLEKKGFASTNVVFGIGSFTYQFVTRDTFNFAMKSTHGVVNGEPVSIFKSPKTDDGMKNSLKGLLRVNEDLTVSEEVSIQDEQEGLLRTVFLDGRLENVVSLGTIRETLKRGSV